MKTGACHSYNIRTCEIKEFMKTKMKGYGGAFQFPSDVETENSEKYDPSFIAMVSTNVAMSE